MEHVDSDLKKVLRSTDSIDFREDHIRVILYNALTGLNFLHSANVMHRDIKPSNILIDADSQVKICDYGFARTIPMNRPSSCNTNDSTPPIATGSIRTPQAQEPHSHSRNLSSTFASPMSRHKKKIVFQTDKVSSYYNTATKVRVNPRMKKDEIAKK